MDLIVFQEKLERSKARFLAFWRGASPAPEWGPEIARSDKIARERRVEQHLFRAKALLRRYPSLSARRQVWREDFLTLLRATARDCLDFPEASLIPLFSTEAMEATRQFIRDAREFDPAIDDSSLTQALRNLWVAHSLQALFGLEISMSPAIFAYSMLYPWTDDCLDSAQVTASYKAMFGEWLERRLRGCDSPPIDFRAEQVSRLVALIEGCFPRVAYPEVYFSLRAIHEAQMRSLSQQDRDRVPNEESILDITFAKGGASVLVDAYLLNGRLDDRSAQFSFGYGVCLQLLDDLQDLRADLENRHSTLFTCRAYARPLDDLAVRTWLLLHRLLWSRDSIYNPHCHDLKFLIQSNCKLLLLQAIAKHREFYTPAFVRDLEAVSPFRFAFLAEREKGLATEYGAIISALRRRAESESAAALLN